MRRLRALAFSALLLLTDALAQDGDEILLLDLCVNDDCVGVAAVVIRDGQALIEREALQAAGVDVDELATTAVGEREFVPAAKINHGTRVSVDRDNLRIDLRIAPANLPMQTVNLRTRVAAQAVQLPLTAFANYSLTLGSQGEGNAFFDGGLGQGALAFRSTGIWQRDGGWQRGLSRVEWDRTASLQRWTVGDQFAVSPDALGGGALLAGFGVERAFEHDPFLVTFPQPFVAGLLDAPGTVEVYANGALIARRELQPGPFSLENLGVPPGRSDVQLIVRDNFGNRRELSGSRFYTTSALLAPGLSDYAVRFGLPRSSAFGGGYQGSPAAQAFYRRGVTRSLTLGARAEGDQDIRNVGASTVWQLPKGDLEFGLAASDSDRLGAGQAQSLTYSYVGRQIGWSLGQRQLTRDYRNLGQSLSGLGAQLRQDRFGSLSLAPGLDYSVLLTFGEQRFTGGRRDRTQGLTLTWRAGSRAQLLFGFQHRQGGGSENFAAIVSLSVALDSRQSTWRPNSVGTAVAWDDDGGGSVRLDAQRSRPPGIGAGYDLNLLSREDGSRQGFARVEYQTPYARLGLEGEQFAGTTRARAVVSGGVVALGGRTYFSPPLQSGFALVRVPGLAGIGVQRENLDVGQTDVHGDLLVRDMVPFFPSQVGVDQNSIPLGYRFGRLEQPVAVPANAGAIVSFDIGPMHAVRGRILIDGGDGQLRAASLGRIAVETIDGPLRARLGSSGAFWFDELAPGVHEATVSTVDAVAHCRLQVPKEGRNGIADLGDLRCWLDPKGEP